MMTTQANEPSIFERIVCGVDGTPASLVAVRQALRLQDEEGSMLLLAVANLVQAVHAGMAATHAADLMQQDAQAALTEAQAIAHSANSKLVNGDPIRVLLEQGERASLIAVGSHGRGRTSGLLLGTVAARVLRDATCSVLIARPARNIASWPKTVVAGVDGSLESAAAFTVASSVAARLGGSLRAVASTKDQFDRETARAIAPELEEQGDRAMDALVAASESADLIVVGNRGLHGLKALGSVSEQVAHQAGSSVLVVRPGQA